MELIRISDSKLKIMLSEADMQHYAITADILNYENTETRRAVWQMLDEAKQKTGFDAASDRVLIQVYPSRRGGCELYITKITTPIADGGEGAVTVGQKSNRKEEASVQRSNEAPASGGRVAVYTFPSLGALLRVCWQLSATGYHGKSAAYLSDDGRAYLSVRETAVSTLPYLSPAPLYHPAEEYGEKLGGAGKLAYIKEHATCLAEEDAVACLSRLA